MLVDCMQQYGKGIIYWGYIRLFPGMEYCFKILYNLQYQLDKKVYTMIITGGKENCLTECIHDFKKNKNIHGLIKTVKVLL